MDGRETDLGQLGKSLGHRRFEVRLGRSRHQRGYGLHRSFAKDPGRGPAPVAVDDASRRVGGPRFDPRQPKGGARHPGRMTVLPTEVDRPSAGGAVEMALRWKCRVRPSVVVPAGADDPTVIWQARGPRLDP